jgi:TonB family protein
MRCSSFCFKIIFVAMTVYLCAPETAWAQTSVDPELRPFIEKVHASVVVITGENSAGQPITPGLGFFIKENVVATDNRVVQSALRVHVRIAGQESDAEVTSRDDYHLAAILRLAKVRREPLELGASDKVAVNDNVFMVGDGKDPMLPAVVTRIITIKGSRHFVLSIPMIAGKRGSPVFNSQGQVIGIAAQNPEQPDESIVIPASDLMVLRSFGEPGGGMGMGTGPGLPSYGPGSGPPKYNEPSKPVEKDPNAPATSVDTRPVLLTHIAPRYTEVARKNNIQGSVTMRVLVGADGEVKQIRITRGLPDGLDEQAIAAVRQSKFKPATKDGQAVPFWLLLSVEFNLR